MIFPRHSYDTRYAHLPRKAREAVSGFVKWSQKQLLKEQNETTPADALYHYTGNVSFHSILKKQQIWCFRHLHRRDETEFEYSLQIAREEMRSVGWSKNPFQRCVCCGLDDMLEVNSLVDTFEFYLFSLSKHRDDRQQWLEYGNEGRGFAIGFAPPLFQPDKDTLSDKASDNLHVGRVIYGEPATRARHRRGIEKVAELVSRYGNANIKMPRDKEHLLQFIHAMETEFIASQLVWNCLTAKDIKYANEREVRYVIMNLPGKFDDIRRELKLDDRIKHYVEADLPLKKRGNIKEILIGPLAPKDAEAKARIFLKKQGYPAIRVVRSKVTL
jgi:hypothetical protein